MSPSTQIYRKLKDSYIPITANNIKENINTLYNGYVRTNLIARVSQIQGHEIRVVLYARLDDDYCLLY